ncbi:hypothetical protein [Actinokineospora sp. NPDC004072]
MKHLAGRPSTSQASAPTGEQKDPNTIPAGFGGAALVVVLGCVRVVARGGGGAGSFVVTAGFGAGRPVPTTTRVVGIVVVVVVVVAVVVVVVGAVVVVVVIVTAVVGLGAEDVGRPPTPVPQADTASRARPAMDRLRKVNAGGTLRTSPHRRRCYSRVHAMPFPVLTHEGSHIPVDCPM